MFNKDKLIKLMDERNLKIADVSKMCDIAYSTLRDLYTGKNKNPLANTLKKLAKGFGIDSDYFIDLESINKTKDITTIAAHFEGEEFTEEDKDDIEKFIKYVLSKKK